MGCASSSNFVPPKNQIENIWDLYDRKKLLGKGASGEVWLATNKATGKVYAMKKLDKMDPQNAQMFEQEVQILRRLNHPNIVQFVDCYESLDDFIIVTQYLEGGEFFDSLQRMKHYSEREAAKMAKRMIQALAYCHKASIVHRDLKPENYVFETTAPDSEMKLIDFGCAKYVEDDKIYRDMAGTPYYIAPEVLDNNFNRNGKVLKAADMWSCGVIIYIMVTGTPPFNGPDDRSIMRAVSRGHYEWPKNFRISDSLKDLVSKLLRKNPYERITALQSLEHPWIAGLDKNSDEAIDPAVMSSLQEFSSASKIKKAVAKLLVNQMTEDDVKRLSDMFAKLDTDGDGNLDQLEIAAYMKKLFNYDDAQAKQQAANFLKEVDVDNNGKIDVKEFQAAHMRGQLSVDADSIRKAFDAIDQDKDGFLDSKEIAKIMETSGANVGQVVRDIMCEVDKNGDGRISFEEFMQAMKSEKFSAKSSAASSNPGKLPQIPE